MYLFEKLNNHVFFIKLLLTPTCLKSAKNMHQNHFPKMIKVLSKDLLVPILEKEHEEKHKFSCDCHMKEFSHWSRM